MSWFDTTGLASLAKNALKEAQKQIDKALDIQEDQMTSSITKEANTAALVGSAAEQVQVLRAEKKLPGAANREKSKTEPNTPNAEGTKKQIALVGNPSATWGSFTGSFFDSPNAHEMVTTPPKASSATKIEVSGGKRQSVTSNSDSVELISPQTNSPSSELTSPSEIINNNSESVELITTPTTTSELATPDTDLSLPESIVIIASSEACEEEDEEDSLSFCTIMDDTLTASAIDAKFIKQPNETEAGLTAAGTSVANMKLIMSLEDMQTVDSDSTQSFEDIQMQMSGCSLQSSFSKEQSRRADKPSAGNSSNSPPHSNDEMETTTSSDIEIISNPNGDSSSQNSVSRTSPLKLKKHAASGYVASHAIVGLSLKKGHQREPSEISILSEDSQSELDKLQHRISELNDILEAREQRLLQSERQNAALQEHNSEMQSALEALRSSSAGLDSSAEEYTQRLSALEKKFQASIRERDMLRTQIKALRDELRSKIPKDELQQLVAESDSMIAELRLEGEKLSKEILQQSTIIKKLRAKEKTSDALLKKNKEQISSQNDELERLKKTLNAKEEVERLQIEAVHKISSEKRKLEEENAQCRSKIEDLQTKLHTLQASFDAVKAELQQRARLHTDLTRTNEEALAAKKAYENAQSEKAEMQRQLAEVREQLRNSEQQARRREQQLRDAEQQLLQRLEASELRAESSTQEISLTTMPLMRQIESLQNTLKQRTISWNEQEQVLLDKISE